MQATQALRRLPLFASLDERTLEEVARRTAVRALPNNAILFRQGDPCQGLYIVVEGSVRVYRASRDGREQVLHVQSAGQSIAEVPLFDGGPYPASARATEDSRVLFLPRTEFEWLYRHHADIADAVIRELGRRLRRMVRLVEKISLRDVPSRVALTLLEYAGQEGVPHDGMSFRVPRTQEELAEELATTRESVARALAKLRSLGAIHQRGSSVRITSLAALERVGYPG